ncbi:MAG: beta-galactosidase [Clostridia bacterium]|nr:beta-galactosidase [Clostridia bacterium]
MVDLRTEYPRPQLRRSDWLCLNGAWEFEIDNACVGTAKQYWTRPHLDGTITVPYCPESDLSGVGHKDFMNCVWYRKVVTLPRSFDGKRILLHFGAVDYVATVYVNGKRVGSHMGGYTPFSFDITDALTDGENVIVLSADDDVRSARQPAGKQCSQLNSRGCFYTRTTGIWQTVWMEAVCAARVETYRVYPDVSNGAVTLQFQMTGASLGGKLTVSASYEGAEMGVASTVVNGCTATVTLPLKETHLWEIGQGRLYDLAVTLEKDGDVADAFEGYFGLREVGLTDKGMTLNGKIFFGRYILDQGFYPDGIYTASSDEALKFDIEASMKLGFNGARMHQKVFEPRYLYWADRLGYLLWGEYPSWGIDITEAGSVKNYLREWLESVERDFSHPAVIGWCPFNETWDKNGTRQCDDVLDMIYRATKYTDPTRPCIDTSGNYHVVNCGLWDVHDYEQDPVKFASYYAKINEGIVADQVYRSTPKRQVYDGTPVFVSEYGGILWNTDSPSNSWGYGVAVKTEEEFKARYKGLTDELLDNDRIMGLCYTQLTDVEQECNGLLTYQRKFKFDPEFFYAVNTRKAKIEE